MTQMDQLVSEYRRNGVVRISAFLSRQQIEQVKTNLQRYQREIVPNLPEADRVLESNGQSVRNLWRMHVHDAFFRNFASRQIDQALISKLVNGQPVLEAVETFNKPARVGSGVPPHQDNAYFSLTPPDAVTVWIALDAATKENGPIYYIKGSHELGLLPHCASGVAGNSMGLASMPPHDKSADVLCGTLDVGDA